MSDSVSIPILNGPSDHLRRGLNSLDYGAKATHPMDPMGSAGKREHDEWIAKLDNVRRMYGSHMAMRLATERETFRGNNRMPGLRSSSIHHDILMGTDTQIDFKDYLNDPMTRTEGLSLPIQDIMEAKLNIT